MNPDVYRGPWGGKNCRDCPIPVSKVIISTYIGHTELSEII